MMLCKKRYAMDSWHYNQMDNPHDNTKIPLLNHKINQIGIEKAGSADECINHKWVCAISIDIVLSLPDALGFWL